MQIFKSSSLTLTRGQTKAEKHKKFDQYNPTPSLRGWTVKNYRKVEQNKMVQLLISKSFIVMRDWEVQKSTESIAQQYIVIFKFNSLTWTRGWWKKSIEWLNQCHLKDCSMTTIYKVFRLLYCFLTYITIKQVKKSQKVTDSTKWCNFFGLTASNELEAYQVLKST